MPVSVAEERELYPLPQHGAAIVTDLVGHPESEALSCLPVNQRRAPAGRAQLHRDAPFTIRLSAVNRDVRTGDDR